MFEFFKRHKTPIDPPNSVSPESILANHSLQQGHSRRETIRVVFKDTLQMHGIAPEWLACEVLIVRRSNKSDEVHIQLVMLKWNEKLLRYAPALEQQLRHELNRFDPAVDHSNYIISWRFSPDRNYPFSVMPDPKFWAKSSTPPPQVDTEPVSILDRRRARRPSNRQKPDAVVPEPTQQATTEYPATQIAPLR